MRILKPFIFYLTTLLTTLLIFEYLLEQNAYLSGSLFGLAIELMAIHAESIHVAAMAD
ncbi:MAG TPA: hypothetical protein VN626_09250 [Clostridia bacterium]|nr:hypothetical protein [Clostridia bacterium]